MYKKLLDKIHQEIYPHIYKGKELIPKANLLPIGILTGPSGGGKDTIMIEMIKRGYFRQIVTATTRKRRYNILTDERELVNQQIDSAKSSEEYLKVLEELELKGYIKTTEPANAYIWMRWQKNGESNEEYYVNLIQEYELLENDFHFGNLYGLPKSSLIVCKDTCCLPVIRTDLTGTQTLNKQIPQNEFQLINFAILPDNLEQVRLAILERENNISKAELQERINRNIEEQKFYPEIINFYVKNTRKEIKGRPGLEITVESLEKLTKSLLQ